MSFEEAGLLPLSRTEKYSIFDLPDSGSRSFAESDKPAKRARREEHASSEEDLPRALPSGSHVDEVSPIEELKKEFDETDGEAKQAPEEAQEETVNMQEEEPVRNPQYYSDTVGENMRRSCCRLHFAKRHDTIDSQKGNSGGCVVITQALAARTLSVALQASESGCYYNISVTIGRSSRFDFLPSCRPVVESLCAGAYI